MSHKSVILDSSIWIAFYLENDIFHYEALRIIGMYEKRKYRIYLPVIVLIELITVLSRKGVDTNKIYKICKFIRSTRAYYVYSINEDVLIDLALEKAEQFKLRTQDFIILLHYVKLGTAKFESFDTKLLENIGIYQRTNG